MTRLLIDVRPAVSQRVLIADDSGVVATHIPELLVEVDLAVEVNDRGVLDVSHIVILDPFPLGAPTLAPSLRQSVGTLDIPVITQLEQAVVAGGGVTQGIEEFTAPSLPTCNG